MMGRGTFETMRHYKDEIAKRSLELEPLKAGSSRAEDLEDGVWVDVTESRIQMLEHDIALFEQGLAHMERQLSED
jgi:hypothetical protein